MNLEEKKKRMDFLYETAVGRCLDKMDWDMFDWLTSEEAREYERLQIETGEKEAEK